MHPFPQHVPPPQIHAPLHSHPRLNHVWTAQAKPKTRSHTHPHKHGHTFAPTLTLHPSPSHPPPTMSMTPTRSSTNINTHPCIPSLILSRLAWGRHGQGLPITLPSLAPFHPFYKPVSRLVCLNSNVTQPCFKFQPNAYALSPLTRVTFATPLTQRDTTNKITPTNVHSFHQLLKPT
ncbi:hypothetical protein PIB30_100964, partial [Stylosanthes scabra]|nr:hypothetical protein [Stylosanthes scabra]